MSKGGKLLRNQIPKRYVYLPYISTNCQGEWSSSFFGNFLLTVQSSELEATASELQIARTSLPALPGKRSILLNLLSHVVEPCDNHDIFRHLGYLTHQFLKTQIDISLLN